MRSLWGEDGLLNWWKLRSTGNLVVLKVSYATLAATPFLTKFKEIGKFLNLYDEYVVLASFFGGIFLGAANLFYDIGCPTIIKRFDSPNTLYKEMLEIKRLSLKSDAPNAFNASLKHCRDAYIRAATSRSVLGITCGLLFVISAIFFIFILVDRIYAVIAEF